jgi:hypothetical protein
MEQRPVTVAAPLPFCDANFAARTTTMKLSQCTACYGSLVRLLLVPVVLMVGCAPMSAKQTAPTDTPLPDFTLLDVNPGSATSGRQVGPLSLRGKVSGWYFTHSS